MTGSNTRLIIIAFVILGAAFILFNDNILDLLFAKFNKTDFRYMSTLARLNSITGNISIWMKNPLFGVGAKQIATLYKNFALLEGSFDLSNTNGLLTHFSMYGAVEGVAVITGVYKFARLLRNSQMSIILVFIIFVIMFSSEPLMTSVLLNTIIFYGIPLKQKIEKGKGVGVESCYY